MGLAERTIFECLFVSPSLWPGFSLHTRQQQQGITDALLLLPYSSYVVQLRRLPPHLGIQSLGGSGGHGR
jgi:hypothetical protein